MMTKRLTCIVSVFIFVLLACEGCNSRWNSPDGPKKNPFSISETLLELKVGTKKMLDIEHGSGEYEVTNKSEGVVKITIEDTHLVVEALLAGKTDVKIKDTKYHEEVTLSITVNELLSINEQQIVLVIDETKKLSLENGSGEYEIANSNQKAVEVTLDNNDIVIKAISVGDALITITDKNTDDKIEVSIKVRASLSSNTSTLEFHVGETESISLENGSGKYEIEYSEKNIISASVNNNNVIINALNVGVVDLSITDVETKDNIIISIKILDVPIPDGVIIENDIIKDWPAYAIPASGVVRIPAGIIGIGDEAFAKGPIQELYTSSSLKTIGRNAFAYCNSLTKIVLSEGLVSIGESAFYQCHKLLSANIPSSVESMGANMFAYCDMLNDIVLGDGLTSIGESAFAGCKAITEIVLPQSLTAIADNAFYECTNLTKIEIPDGVTEILTTTFKECTALVSVKLPSNIKSIGRYAFLNCTSLTEIILPNSLTQIQAGAFSGCSNLRKVVLPTSLDEIQASTFENCSGLNEVSFSQEGNLTKIGIKAFQSCESLTKIIIPEGVKEINNMAFRSCSKLSEVDLPSSLTSIRLNSFYACTELKKLVSRAITPPTLLGNPFNKTHSDRVLYTISDDAKLNYTKSSWSRAFPQIEVLK